MNVYTKGIGINDKLVTVEDDIEDLIDATEALTEAYTPTPTDTKLVDQALTVSGGATPSLTMTDIACTGARLVAVQVNNKGSATSVTVNIYGAISTLAYTDVPETTQVTLNASTTKCDIITLTNIPYDKVKVVIANTDGANATTIDAVVRVIV